MITSGINATQRILRVNEQVLKDSFDFYGKLLEVVISRPSPRKAGPASTFLTNIMNNPILKALLSFNPMSWAMEAVNEEMGDAVKLPSFPFLSTLSSTAVRIGLSALKRIMVLFERLFENLVTLISDPTNAVDILLDSCRAGFWSAFEGVKEIVLELYGLLVALFNDMDTFLNDVWVLPGLTDLWYDYTGMDFSLMNLLTYTLAQIIEIFYDGEKAAFDGWDLEAMFGGKNISDEELKLFDVPKDVPLHSIQMVHNPIPHPVHPPPIASNPNTHAEAFPTQQGNSSSRIQVIKSASVSMPEMTIKKSAGGPGDGLPVSSGPTDGASTDEKSASIEDETKDFLTVKLLSMSPLRYPLLTVSPGDAHAEIPRWPFTSRSSSLSAGNSEAFRSSP